MQLEFLGAAREVTGSCHFVSFSDICFLVDCGMEQGPDLYKNQELPVNPATLDFVFVTHAHIDHSGLLPLLYKNGFRGKIYATKATCELCRIMLQDSAHIQEQEAEWKNRKARRAGDKQEEPIYSLEDALHCIQLFVPCDYGSELEICDGLKVRFVDAGHLLGSASLEIWITEEETTKKIVFSGDLGNGNRPLIKNPDYPKGADFIVCESTYGTSLHEQAPDYAPLLTNVLRDTFSRGGNLVVPAFSVGRTQEILYFLRRIKTENLLPEFPDFEVWMDSPLAVEATGVFHANVSECFNEKARELIEQGINPIRFPGLKTAVTADESRLINFMQQPKVIISASGMCEAGRVRHHLKHNLWRADSTILFVGYQVVGTLGHSLIHGAKKVKLFGEEIEVNARIVNLPGMSGHADRDHLLTWLKNFDCSPEHIFIVHGEEATATAFAETVQAALKVPVTAPYSGDTWDLITGTCIAQGDRILAEKKKAHKTANTVFDRLLAQGQRLLAIIQKSKGFANKDLAKFADQISALCDKWEK